MANATPTFRRAGWLLAAVPFFGISTGALFPLVALELNRLGFGEAFVGSATSLYYAGSFLGALTYGTVLNRAGYKVAFIAMAILAGGAHLALTQFNEPSVWLGFRFLGGYALGAYYVVVDSWISALGTRQTRGRLYATYETLRLLATAVGPALVVVGATSTSFALVTTGYLLSIVPVLFANAPMPEARSHKLTSQLANIARCFPFALAIAFCAGIANASFNGLSAVYGKAVGFDPVLIATFVGVVLVAPAVSEIPIGALADRYRRMPIAAYASSAAAFSCLIVALALPSAFWAVTAASAIVGGCLVPLYALGLSRVADAVGERDAILVATAGVLAYNSGALCGPVAAGLAMEQLGPTGLYVFLGGVALTAALLALSDTHFSWCCREEI